MKIGAQMYTLRQCTQTEQGLFDALTRVQAMGYDYVQLSGHNTDIPPEAIADKLAELRLSAPSTHTAFETMRDRFAESLRYHRLVGATYPGIGAMPRAYALEGASGFAAFAKEATLLAERFRDEGLTLIYHNHDFEFVRYGARTGYDILLEESGDALQFELDTYWAQSGGASPTAWIRRLRGRMDVLHLKDMQIIRVPEENHRTRQVFAEIGQGNLDWPPIFEAAREIGVRYAFVEQDDTQTGRPFDSLRISRDFLRENGL